ncbi:tRNA pseudouridine(55) synthase TruB [Roseofilum casamattae]|uniref:tRNA pseudouridine synthase B n=1 Tax=Roseofilum casamattae BLCC-M143 TaxID=3022442 RepID=A0ABT7C395_9CYAN|nr:tRNA pseudouridine(55) synthase TruB [Roseofilum casamattae]MDJ1185209.1 tRNA pseudouridine(55) synthase TruB [Roseofilum casamattae BLCC-M143]
MDIGFLNVNKPMGWTSHDCVGRVRRLLGIKRVGHAGTLDPAATGVLPIAVGKATRLLQFLPPDKAYEATVRFGIRTDTNDLDGEVTATQSASSLTLDKIQSVLTQFQGKIEQIPPIYSAIQLGGRRLYDLARRGERVEVPMRRVEVHEIRALDWRDGEHPELDLAIACGSGTYIRAIARDLGELVGTGATLARLIRTASSGFTLQNTINLEEIDPKVQPISLPLVSPHVALAHLPHLILSLDEARAWSHGQSVPISADVLSSGVQRVSAESGEFLGIGLLPESEDVGKERQLTPKVVFAG